MTDIEIRIECIKAAVATAGNPNHVQQARDYYAFVMEAAVNAETDTTKETSTKAKGTRK